MFPTRFTAAADTIYSALVRGGSHTSPMGVYYRNVLKHCGHKEVGLNLDTLPLSTRKIHAHRAHASPCTPMYRVFPFKLEMRGWRWMENLSRAIIYLLGKKRVLFTLISNSSVEMIGESGSGVCKNYKEVLILYRLKFLIRFLIDAGKSSPSCKKIEVSCTLMILSKC